MLHTLHAVHLAAAVPGIVALGSLVPFKWIGLSCNTRHSHYTMFGAVFGKMLGSLGGCTYSFSRESDPTILILLVYPKDNQSASKSQEKPF